MPFFRIVSPAKGSSQVGSSRIMMKPFDSSFFSKRPERLFLK